MKVRRRVLVAVAAAGLALAASAAAPEAGFAKYIPLPPRITRYASPSGTGDCTSQSSPCSLSTAVNGASSGDTVVALAGTYTLTSDLATPSGVLLEGQSGTRPVIDITDDGSLGTFSSDSSTGGVSNLDVEATGSAQPLGVDGDGTVSHVIVDLDTSTSDLAAIGIGASSSTISDTLVLTSGSGVPTGIAVYSSSPTPTATLINVTIYSGGAGAVAVNVLSSAAYEVSGMSGTCYAYGAGATLENVIAHGDGAGLETSAVDMGCTAPQSTLSVSYSNYDGALQNNGAVTDNGDNQTSAAETKPSAIFVSPPTNLHELAGSPTIDAGSSAGIESTDLDNNPREVDGGVDMGAYEFIPPTTGGGGGSTLPGGGGGSTLPGGGVGSSSGTKCVVPKLKGKTLKKARKLLGAAHCSLGKVKKPKHHNGNFVVKSQSSPVGTVLADGASVSVKLKPKPKRHH